MTEINKLDIKDINGIVNKVIEGIEASRLQIFDIVENSRNEYDYLKVELQSIRDLIENIIQEVDSLEIQDKIMRRKLVNVSKNFNKYKEEDIKEVYDKAAEIRIKYQTKKNEEKTLRGRRTQLELALKRAMSILENAEKAINQISIAMNFLKGEILSTLEGVDKNSEMFIGIKILEAQENERKRISRDIHDGPAQHIANIVMKADICEKIFKSDLQEGFRELDELKDNVKIALKEVRNIIFDLRPMTLDDLGLNQTIEEFVKVFKKDTNVDIKTELKAITTEVESIIQVAVYRIIQEILNNMKKHSKAKNTHIRVECGTKYIRLMVIDDGIGFDVEETLNRVKSYSESYGIIGILDRVKQLQGEIKIQSTIGVGTVYNVKLPVSREVIKDENSGN